MNGHGVSFVEGSPDDGSGLRREVLVENEEGRRHVMPCQDIEDLWCGGRVGTIIDGEIDGRRRRSRHSPHRLVRGIEEKWEWREVGECRHPDREDDDQHHRNALHSQRSRIRRSRELITTRASVRPRACATTKYTVPKTATTRAAIGTGPSPTAKIADAVAGRRRGECRAEHPCQLARPGTNRADAPCESSREAAPTPATRQPRHRAQDPPGPAASPATRTSSENARRNRDRADASPIRTASSATAPAMPPP